jgi:hypothetical protein
MRLTVSLFLVFMMIFTSKLIAAEFKDDENPTVQEVVNKSTETESPTHSEEMSSEELASQYLDELGLSEGENGDLFIAIGSAQMPEEDPATNPDFITLRELKANEAALEAKRMFIEYVRTEISASDIVTLPETPLGTDFDNKKNAVTDKVNKALRKYKKALRTLDKSEHKKNKGIGFDELAKEGIIAGIQKIKPDFDPSKVEQKKNIDAYNEAKAELEATEEDYNNLVAEAETLKGKLGQENVSSVETFASMSVVGLVPIASFEAWDGETYTTTQIAIWTNKEEKRTRELYAGMDVKFDAGEMSLKDFIKSTDWSTAQGARKFFDDKGNFWLLAIGSHPIKGNSSSAMRKAKGFARTNAQKQIAYILYSEAQAKQVAQAKMQEISTGKIDGSMENQSVTSFAETLSQKVEKKNIQGMSQKLGKKYTHPISGQKMYVSVYGLSSSGVRKARLIEGSQARASQDQIKENERSKGVKAGIEKTITDTKNDKSSFNKGFKEGVSKAKSAPSSSSSTIKNNKSSSGSSKKGGFKGGGTTSGAFK